MAQPDRPGPNVRIGTEQREAAMRALGQHLSTGHLDVGEYTERVEQAAAARTVGELDALFEDLPGPHQQPPPPVPGPHQAPMPPVPMYLAPVFPLDQYGRPLSDKSKVVAGLLQILLPFGVGRMYAGDAGTGVAQLIVAVVTCGIGSLWSLIDGIIILAQGGTDGQGRQLRDR